MTEPRRKRGRSPLATPSAPSAPVDGGGPVSRRGPGRPPVSEEGTARLVARVGPATKAEIEARAEQLRTSAAELVREAVERYLRAPSSEPETLAGTCDAVIVTRQPVERWAQRDGLGIEEARRAITAIAALARPVDAQVEPELWRYRRGRRIDVRLRVVREEVHGARLAIVTSATWGPR